MRDQEWQREVRPYFCMQCQTMVSSTFVPHGWYHVARHRDGEKALRLGLFCSARCMARHIDRLAAIEAERGDDWHHSTIRQRRSEGRDA